MFWSLGIWTLLVGAAVALSGCASGNPTNNTWYYGEDVEIEKGTKQHEQILKRVGAYESDKVSAYVSAVGMKLASVSERPTLPWRFTVLDSGTPNAFAVQGGYVYITRGMLAVLRSEDELAAVLGHEIGHICSRDAVRSQTAGELAGLTTLGAALVTAPALLLLPQVLFAPAGAGMAAISRENELRADEHGVKYLQRTGYPHDAMARALQAFSTSETYARDRANAAGRNLGGIWHRVFASHPKTEVRQDRLDNESNSAARTPDSAYAAAFLSTIDGLEFGDPRVTGILSGEERYFRDWKAAMRVPDGWRATFIRHSNQLWISKKSGGASMRVGRAPLIRPSAPCESLEYIVRPATLSGSQPLQRTDATGCTAITMNRRPSLFFERRDRGFSAALIVFGLDESEGFFVRGFSNKDTESELDQAVASIANSLRILQPDERIPPAPALRFRNAQPADTFQSLARNAPAIDDVESLLRVVNQRYPDGEPKPGELIKIIE